MSSTPSSTEAKPVEQSNKDLERSDAGIIVEEDPTFPDGGMKAWMTVCGAFFMQITAGYLFAFGVYQDFFVESFLSNFSVSQISWIGSVSTFITFTLGFFTGGLFDAGFFRFLITFGSLLVVFSLFMLSLTQAQHYYQVFLSLGIGYGLGDGMIYVPTIAVISHWFQRRRALAMGIATSGFSIGATFHPIMLNNLFHGSVGFANGVRASAGLFAGCLLIGSLLMRSRLPPAQHDISIPALLAKFARDLPYVGVCLALVAYTSGGLFPPFYLQLDSDSRGLSQTFGFYSLAIMNGSGFFGRLASGPLADTFGVFNALCFTAISSSALIFGLLGVKSVAGVVVFAVLFGFFLNAYIALLSPLFASFATDPSEIGARIGIGYTFIGLGSLIGTPITGALLSRRFTWWRPIVYSGTVTMVATGVYIVCRFAVSKRRATWKV